jgi:NAD(P)H-hydrate epimerase
MEKYSQDKNNIVMTREEVRSFDAWAINTLGIPGVVLMENAGRSCAELIRDKIADVADPRVCIFCGTGNNGGDGYVIARDRNKIKGDAKINLDILESIGVSIEQLNPAEDNIAEKIRTLTEGADMIVDSLFGTGLKGPLSEEYIRLIESINARSCPILAVDIPSGLDCDTGRPLGAAIEADYTVTFVAVKKGFTAAQTAKYTGEIFIASIGVVPH